MKEMSLREVQLACFDILKDVHLFCTSNNIRYSLAYGTLLGAIRHEGFIPWDDDIDIIMPKPDYDRFCKTFKSNANYEIFSPVLDNSYLNYARVCDLDKTYVHSLPWCNESPTGVWIDIFPIVGVDPDEMKEDELTYLTKLNDKKYRDRIPMEKLSRPMPMQRKLKAIAKKILFWRTDVKTTIKEYEQYINRIDFTASKYCGNKSITTYYWKEKYPTSFFDSFIDVDFEGVKLKSLANYKDYLRIIYGDYMQLPPIEKRLRHPQEMYWR